MAGEYLYPDGRQDKANIECRGRYSGDSMAIKRIWRIFNEFRSSTAIIALMLFAPVAMADGTQVASFQFNGNLGDIGQTDTYTSGLFKLVLAGYSADNTPANMWEKALSPTETGIGLSSEVDHEIAGSDFIQMRMFNTLTNQADSALLINSIQSGETYSIYGSNTAGIRGDLIDSGQTNAMYALLGFGKYDYISLSADSGNVDLEGLSITTPEPSTLLLLGVCLLFFFIGVYGFSSRVASIVSK